ncbi:hypothetical protein NC797_04330 [Aquibacillus sp. 3ASR75-11]|uniref:Uncharacterized protein n=1 Tax=Terrihalobacillus insolitus TaxID=2950438 RepID=A0A9X3WUP5_9BACI|nr:hypothetical protein [Terrihalobacillus insolitus]MDC3412789.1 hypothetical protein [Terrihalobacillus insolitus]MDC3423734.1 hypothetical protein [Terrihalobacillus insolitus]
MIKKVMFIVAGAITTSIASYLAICPDRLKKTKEKEGKNGAIQVSNQLPIKQAGVPDIEDPENAKMVSEGSQFGVHYYNERQHSEL